MQLPIWVPPAVFVADMAIRLGLFVRVISRRRPVAISLAWIAIAMSFPFAGAIAYLLFGELRLGKRRAEAAKRLHGPYQHWLDSLRGRCDVDWQVLGEESKALAKLSLAAGGIPAIPGTSWQILDDAEVVFASLIADIDAAQRTCHLEFYIWTVGGTADLVAEALMRASARGVACRVLVDAVGSRGFLRDELSERLRRCGVAVRAAMPVGPLRSLFVRFDLRLHRKIVVIDGETAYTGSMNLVDPRFFKKDAGVGPWVDAMARLRGPVVEAMAITFLEDWDLETGEAGEQADETLTAHRTAEEGSAVVQLIPSGPLAREETIQSVLLMTIYDARREIVLTTPYFVPDEALLTALSSAARRGVEVLLVVPAKVDSKLARLASQPHKGQLLEAGVRIFDFDGGLLHTKSVTVDGVRSLFGSLNLDPRSMMLNFEITLAVYDAEFTESLRALQETYLERSTEMSLIAWQDRAPAKRFVEDAARLLSPLI